MTTFVRRSCMVTGVGLIAASLFADGVSGFGSTIGWRQVLGCLVGAGILGAGTLSARAALPALTVRWIVAAYAAACSLVIWLVDPLASAGWMLLGCAAAVCLLLPLRFGLLTFAGVLALNLALAAISRIKVNLTGMPLTMLDIRIAAANPSGLWEALSLPPWSRHATVALIVLALVVWTFAAFVTGHRFLRRGRRGVLAVEPWARFAAIGVIGAAGWLMLNALFPAIGRDDSTWHTDQVSRLADRVGVLAFLAYSYHIESGTGGAIYAASRSPPPDPEEVGQAVAQYFRVPRGEAWAEDPLPNVVMVLAESTFDPGQAFRLEGQWNAGLFTAGELTAATGPLRVNTKGGGTWVAEFETITGLDSRLFGYSGAYTHASLSPFVERSFATWLGERGYATWAFLSNTGSFYNSRRAYENYGFRHVLDSADLGSETAWFDTDVAVVESAVRVLGDEPAEPFFAYVLLIENHSPHECNVEEGTDFPARFADSEDFSANCALHEYLRRLDSTTKAVGVLLEYLQALEIRTGRPYVVLVFGDHQPSTFVGSGEFLIDYTPLRTAEGAYTTFFHLLTSTARRVECCSAALPVAALPTLASGFVAASPEEVYLGENLWLHANCGSDAVRQNFADRLAGLETQSGRETTGACKAAYERALTAFRRAGVIALAKPGG